MDALLLLAAKVAASTCIGMLIGLERSWAHKEAGVRSFAIATLLGTLSWLVSPTLAYVQVGTVLVVLILVNVHAMWNGQSPEITTSLALAAAVAPSYGFFLACRIFVGFGFGATGSVVPVYLSEVAPANLRGRLVTFNQIAIT